MTPSKVEIKLRKAEPGKWSNLNFPREQKKVADSPKVEKEKEDDDLVDLSDVEAANNIYKVNISELEQVE